MREEAHKGWALTERPACFEIDPRKACGQARPRMSAYTAHHCAHTAERSPLHDVRQPAPRDRGSTRYKSRCMDEFRKARSRHNRSTAAPPKIGGARRDRTDDLLLAKQALSQLSYGPVEGRLEKLVGLGRFELPTSRLSSARSNQLSYKPPKPRGLATPQPKDRPAFIPDG